MAEKQKLELTWIGKNEELKLEPRILIEDPDKSYGDKNTENMLIHGDNLLALKALEHDYTGRIKCIYIDPPYNTGNAFEYYDDGLEHSIWLNLMERRIKILYNLLCNDGTIIVHIDENEMAYLKVLMDEIFGRSNFVNTIVIRDSHPSGLKLANKDKKIIKSKSYMLIYKKSDLMRINPIYQKREIWDTHFNVFLDIDKSELERKSLKDYLISIGIMEKKEKISEDSLKSSSFKKFCFENRDKVFQSTKELPDFAKEESLLNKDKVYEYTNNGERQFAYNGRRLSPLSKSIHNIGIDGENNEDFAKLLCDFWDDVDFNNTQNEGKIPFPASKKPEYLIARLLTMFTSKEDFVLDSFLGSGTTVAVAHKMNRRWIGIELGDHCYTHSLSRLKLVVNGDESGISKSINWKGGGGFKFYELAPSLLKKDKYDNWVIDENYNADLLASAVAKHEGFNYSPDSEIFWKHGKSTETDHIFTTTSFINTEYLDRIASEMRKDESLLICCKNFQQQCEDKYSNITIKKIPQMLLGKCEFGKEDYSLNIINFPHDEAEDIYEEDIDEEILEKKSDEKTIQTTLF